MTKLVAPPGLSPLAEQIWMEREARAKTLRQGGENIVDHWGRLRFPIVGDGPETSLIVAGQPIRQRRKSMPQSEGFDRRAFERMFHAVAFANLRGWTLNTLITVSWETAGIEGDEAINAAHQGLLVRLREWCTRRKHPQTGRPAPMPCAYISVREWASSFGHHSHILMAMEPRHRPRLGVVVKRYVEKISGQPCAVGNVGQDGRAMNTVRLDAPSKKAGKFESREAQLDFQWKVFRYLAKGATRSEWARLVGTDHATIPFGDFARICPRDQGQVAGKRTGYSTATLGQPAWLRFAAAYELDEGMIGRRLREEGPHYGDEFLRQGDLLRQLRGLEI
jgi:hypothetical protein